MSSASSSSSSASSTAFISSVKDYFTCVPKIEYNPAKEASFPFAFRHYNASEVVMGKKMSEWLKFSVCYWHTFRGNGLDPFGGATITREWDDNTASLENAKRRLVVAFNFMKKLGVEYWSFHDRDISPIGATLAETNANLDVISDLALELQNQTGIKLLWGTANLFSENKFMNGAATNPDAAVFAHAAAQVKKAMEVTQKLGGSGYVFWGGREGFQSVLNTDVRRELDHFAAFLKMAVDYKAKLGFTGQLMIEPKPKEPTKHQYDYDAQTVIGFLRTYGLEKDFKLNIEPNHTTLAGHSYEHDIVMSSRYGMLGSIDANTGDQSLGWDTDQFPSNVRDTTLTMLEVIRQGGLGQGGLNFDCKVRRESNEIEDMFIAHIGAMDAFAFGLKKAALMLQDGVLVKMIAERYASYDSGIGEKIEKGQATFEELAKWVEENETKLKSISGKQERYEQLFNYYLLKQ